MGAAIQLYAGFALLVMAIIAIIAIAAIVSNLMAAVRRRFGRSERPGSSAKSRAHDDFSAPARSSRSGASRSDTPASPPDNPPASR